MTTAERAVVLRKMLYPLEGKQTPLTEAAIVCVDSAIKVVLDAAVADERKACAKVAASFVFHPLGGAIAAAILKRGET